MDKSKLTKAFKELRKQGYFARQNFWCCQSCAWADMTDEQADKAVFYHAQDNDNLKENGSCHLAWSGDGKLIVDILEKNGIEVDWDGSDNKRIGIKL